MKQNVDPLYDRVMCPICGGSGRDSNQKFRSADLDMYTIKCAKCNGTGSIVISCDNKKEKGGGGEMKPVRQTRFNKGDGNCFNACIATLLDLPIEKVDVVWNEDNWLKQLDDIIHPLGYCFIEWEWNNDSQPWIWVGNCYMIASGDGPRGCKHSVIVHHSIDADTDQHRVINHWDPHPEDEFLKTIDYVGVLFPHWESIHKTADRAEGGRRADE